MTNAEQDADDVPWGPEHERHLKHSVTAMVRVGIFRVVVQDGELLYQKTDLVDRIGADAAWALWRAEMERCGWTDN